MRDITCHCGAEIPYEDVDFSNRSNELGEDYAEVSVQCNSCKKEFETSQWGEFENKEEAVEYLIEYITNTI